MAGAGAGRWGQFYMALETQGVETIYPVGLEKLIPRWKSSPLRWEDETYGHRVSWSDGARSGWPGVITEIEAIDILFG